MLLALLNIIAQNNADTVQLEPAGMVMMGLSIAIVLSLTSFCVYRILRAPSPEEHHHTPLDIDTQDREM